MIDFFTNTVDFDCGREYMIVETDRTKYFRHSNFKYNYLSPACGVPEAKFDQVFPTAWYFCNNTKLVVVMPLRNVAKVMDANT